MEASGGVPSDPEALAIGEPATGPAPGAPGAAGPGRGVWRTTVDAVEEAVPRARGSVRELLAARGMDRDDPLLADLLLIVSELVTNAVRHAAARSPRIGLEVACDAERVRIAVRDRHPYRPRAVESAADDTERTGGRGLLLVTALAREAGGRCDVERTPDGGKVVWAELRRDGHPGTG